VHVGPKRRKKMCTDIVRYPFNLAYGVDVKMEQDSILGQLALVGRAQGRTFSEKTYMHGYYQIGVHLSNPPPIIQRLSKG
jgi:hypothetical protein